MRHIKYLSGAVFALAFFLAGCEPNLDLKPIAKPTEVSFYIDASSIDATVTATYAQLSARQVFDLEYSLVLGSIPSDDVECGGETVNDYPTAQHTDQLLHTPTIDAAPTEDIWDYCYKGCRLANTALEKVQIPDIASKEFIDVRTGEVKFLRAFYHFILVQVFGGVPISEKIIQPAEYFRPRNTIKEVLAFCEEDLKDAISKLPEHNSPVGRVTKGSANALLAKVLLYESSYAKNYSGDDRFTGCTQRWGEALQYAEAVINSNVYKLVGEDGGERHKSWRTLPDETATIDAYRWLFTVDGDNSSEGIFEIQSVNDDLGYGATRGNALTVFSTCRKYKISSGVADVGGWSFNCPTDYLVQSFRNADPGNKPARHTWR